MINRFNHFSGKLFTLQNLEIAQPADDISIWEYAKKNNFTILSKDDDFEKIVLLRKAPPKLVYLKTFNLSTKGLLDLILKNKEPG